MSYYDQESNRWRRNGYADGKAGKPGMYSDQHYQRGYREGLRALAATRLPIVNVRLGGNQPEVETMSGTVKRSKRLFVAVVFAERGSVDSLKSDGQWTCYIGLTQNEAIAKAMDARERWDTSPIDRHKYVVVVGELTSKVKQRAAYDLVTINA